MTFDEVKEYLENNALAFKELYEGVTDNPPQYLLRFISSRLGKDDLPIIEEKEEETIKAFYRTTMKALIYRRLTEDDQKNISVALEILSNISNMYPEEFSLLTDICKLVSQSKYTMEETIAVLKLLLKETSSIVSKCTEPSIDFLSRVYYDSYTKTLEENDKYEVD